MQEQLRLLSRQLLSAQEEERKMISRELHDQIAQTLTGINIRLAALKTEATVNTKGLQKKISSTQRLVEKSVDIVHRFARELRPTVLDDLGLIPALLSFMKSFNKRTGVRTSLTAFAAVERLDTAKRTVLFRIAQEALNNVARHAHASRVEVNIQKLPDCICMKIKDDGKSFQVHQVLHAKGNKHLGLLGMRERLEMIGGSFGVESAPGKGTTIQAQIPLTNVRAREDSLMDLAEVNKT
jgi:signal transduction histidine kinase